MDDIGIHRNDRPGWQIEITYLGTFWGNNPFEGVLDGEMHAQSLFDD